MGGRVIVLDTEFMAPPGHRPTPVCLCAWDLTSGETWRLWHDELHTCPFDTENDIFICFFASAEWSVFLVLGWPLPRRCIDLYVEHRRITNGGPTISGNGLLGALSSFGLGSIAPAEKQRLRDRIMSGPPYDADEKQEILDYCWSDVAATARLLEAMEPHLASSPIVWGQCLLRGRYMRAVAEMEHTGIPVDMSTLTAMRERWEDIKRGLIDETDTAYGVYEGPHFREELFERFVLKNGYAWPTLDSGKMALDQQTFKDMCRLHPELEGLRQLRHTLGEMRLADISIGPDGRNRTLLSAFKTITSRNAPSSSRFIFGPSTWLRFLIKPGEGRAIAYCDFKSQEIGIAASVSGDTALMRDVQAGDPYLSFAKRAGLVPEDATKQSHPVIRDAMKSTTLAVGYGMVAETLALRLGKSVSEAIHLLRLYDEAYPNFAKWRMENLDRALLGLTPTTRFGWTLRTNENTKPNTLRNWPIQSTGSEMLRLACCLATERGLMVCAPIHDALLLEDNIEDIEHSVLVLQDCMREASSIVLGNFTLDADSKVFSFPSHYYDARGAEMYTHILKLINL